MIFVANTADNVRGEKLCHLEKVDIICKFVHFGGKIVYFGIGYNVNQFGKKLKLKKFSGEK